MNYLVTGAASGIGKRCVERLVEKGGRCILVDRDVARLDELCKRLGDCVIAVPVDLSLVEEIAPALGKIDVDNWFPVHGVVHCAGIAPLKRIEENEISVVKTTYTINILSFVELMRWLVAENRMDENASVVTMSSVAAQRGPNRQSVYAGTKAALEATVRCMARELISKKIRINAISSGAVETEMFQKLREESPNLDERMKVYYPLGVIPVDEVCDMFEFLLSEKSAHITGTTVSLDSGYLL